MINVIEKPQKPTFKRVWKNNKPSSNEVPKHIFPVIVNNKRQQKKEPENKIKQKIKEEVAPRQLGLPPQPEGYLKFPDYDWL